VSTGALLFSGTDLATVCIVEDLADFWSSADVRGDLPTYAGVPGATPMRRPVASKMCSGQVTVYGGTLAATEDGVAAVKALLRIGRSQTVTRRKVTGAGNLDTTQTAITRSAVERWQYDDKACTLLLGVETLDGPWYGASTAIAAVGTVTIAGDSPTRAITATLSAGAVNPVVTNTDNGYTFRYVGTIPAGGVLVDVRARTATGITGSVNLTANLRWSKDDPFQLDPGAQTLTVSDGTASFTYLPAYA
jgi:hypothetical protein